MERWENRYANGRSGNGRTAEHARKEKINTVAIILMAVMLLGVGISCFQAIAFKGKVQDLIGLREDIAGRTVVILEDMIDSGESIMHMKKILEEKHPKQVKVAALFYKPKALKYDLTIDYKCIALENDFVVGHGLDYDGLGRNYPDLYTIEN